MGAKGIHVGYPPASRCRKRDKRVNLIKARLTYSFFDNATPVVFWGKNLSGEAHFTRVTPLVASFGTFGRCYAARRTLGGELAYRF